jgi:hypothetical protein
MKNIFYSVLVSLLVLPAFAAWLPHGTMHALHEHQAEHHSVETSHKHEGHDHKVQEQEQEAAHHSITMDVVTYFSEYLHVDLQSPDQITLTAPARDHQDIHFTLMTSLSSQHRQGLTSVHGRATPDWRWHRPNNTPLYLSTQRLRI